MFLVRNWVPSSVSRPMRAPNSHHAAIVLAFRQRKTQIERAVTQPPQQTNTGTRLRTGFPLAAITLGIPLLVGSGISLGRQAVSGQNWAGAVARPNRAAAPGQPAAKHQPPAPRNWATPQ